MKKTKKANTLSPEKLSGHDLVDYLIAHPGSEGNFKWHTLRSCMWRRLLSARSKFSVYADPSGINYADALLLVDGNWKLFPFFGAGYFTEHAIANFLAVHPQISQFVSLEGFSGFSWTFLLQRQPCFADQCRWEKLNVSNWYNLLRCRPEFADKCSFNGFTGSAWSGLLCSQPVFADRCRWESLAPRDWNALLKKRKDFLKYLKLEYVPDAETFHNHLRTCYFGDCPPARGMFCEDPGDVSSYLILKSMDREHGKRYLKKQYAEKKWAFAEEVASISREEAMDVPGKKYMIFYLALCAPDGLFEKCFLPEKDLVLRDPGGNCLLMPALVRGLCTGDMKRYELLLSAGLDPDEENAARYSCSDLLKRFFYRKEYTVSECRRT